MYIILRMLQIFSWLVAFLFFLGESRCLRISISLGNTSEALVEFPATKKEQFYSLFLYRALTQ